MQPFRLKEPDRHAIAAALRECGIVYALVFGSAARGELEPESDLDIAVSAEKPLSSDYRATIIGKLAAIVKRPVDLIDLRTARGLVYAEALRGEELFCDSTAAKGDALKRRVGIIEEDLLLARRSFALAQPRMFR